MWTVGDYSAALTYRYISPEGELQSLHLNENGICKSCTHEPVLVPGGIHS
jgi:hypothetical protein